MSRFCKKFIFDNAEMSNTIKNLVLYRRERKLWKSM